MNVIQSDLTVVTGLWDMGRDRLTQGFERPMTHYINHFSKLLETDQCFYVYTSADIAAAFKDKCDSKKVFFKIMEVEEFRTWFCFYKETQAIRNREEWRERASWLSHSPQANLEFYNPVVLGKMFLLNDVAINNPFKSEYFVWLDAGITNTVHSGYFTHDKVLNKITPCLNKFLFLSFPYEDSHEIHGFDRSKANQIAGVSNIKYVCRGGLFGGKKEHIHQQNGLYYDALNQAFGADEMGTEETIFAILAHKRPELYNRFMLEAHGMISNFCEALKNDVVEFQVIDTTKQNARTTNEFVETNSQPIQENSQPLPIQSNREHFTFTERQKTLKTSLYFLAFNFPDQLRQTLSTLQHHYEFAQQTMKYCIDNSTSLEARDEYRLLCKEFGMIHLPMEKNLGICGGRQWIAEHFNNDNDADYYIFFEDDMGMCERNSAPCRSGFIRWTPQLLPKCIHIMESEQLDFLKLSFSEFFGTNSKQWSWHNVPQDKREIYWPDIPQVKEGLHGPHTRFTNIKTYLGLPYATGEIYYSNWPCLFNKTGNQKMFLEVKWASPFEQTWMSYAYTETKEGRMKPGILLASTIEHNRMFHYSAGERREN